MIVSYLGLKISINNYFIDALEQPKRHGIFENQVTTPLGPLFP